MAFGFGLPALGHTKSCGVKRSSRAIRRFAPGEETKPIRVRRRELVLIMKVKAPSRKRAARSLAARGETPAAFGRRCIPPPPQRGCRVGGPGAGCVAPRSNTPGIAPHRAQHARWGPRSALVAPLCRGPHGADCAPWGGTSGRIAALGATLEFHHGLLGRVEDVTRRAGRPGRLEARTICRRSHHFA